MTRFLKLVRHENGSWQALAPAEARDLESSSPPVTTSLKKNAPIDPTQLLNALAPLLSTVGGINSVEKAQQFASLMKKFSKKLVSRCVYCNVLKATEKDILSRFLSEGGWDTINMWLADAKATENIAFMTELLELCKLLPMSVERLKENSTPKLVKSLTKVDNEDVRSLSDELIMNWMKIIKGDDPPVATSKLKKKKPVNKVEIKEEKPVKKTLKKSDSVEKEKTDLVKDKKVVKKVEKRKELDKDEKSNSPPKRLKTSKNETVVSKTAKTKGGSTEVKKESSVSKTSAKTTSVPAKTAKENSSGVGKVSKDSPASKTAKESVSQRNVKDLPKKPPTQLKIGKRTNSESKDSDKSESAEDTKVSKADIEQVSKKPKTERPKTVKSFQTKFRATGLEEELPLPKKVNKKVSTVDKATAAAVLAKTAPVKRLIVPGLPDRIMDKKVKPENLLKIDESANPAGGIKLIPAKPQPLHILHESASFMDALTAQPPPPLKRKKKGVNKAATTPPTTPTSPPSGTKAPKLEFKKESSESEDSKNKEDTKSEDVKVEEMKTSPDSPDNKDFPDPVVKKDTGEDEAVKKEDSNDSSTKDDGGSTPVDEESNPNELKSILAHGKRRLKRKNVRWVDDENLKMIHYFELDETERVNVLRNRPFGDLKTLEAKRERELFEQARRHAGDKMEEAIPWWTTPVYIDCPPPLVEPGIYSQEREIQHLRQQSILQEIYFNREMLPDSPQEPDPETVVFQEPKMIPLDEENTGPLVDYSGQEIPKPKTTLPEVLSSLIKMSASKPEPQPVPPFVPNPVLSQANMNPVVIQPPVHQLNMMSPSSPYEVEDRVSRPLLGTPPPMNSPSPMYNTQQMMEPPEGPMHNNWGPSENMMPGDKFYGNFPVSPNMDVGPPHPPPYMSQNMRPRMPSGPMMGGGGNDMFRPNVPKGSRFRPGGPRRGGPRVPCRNFVGRGGCRYGINCNFLHPGVNGPPL